MWDVMQLVLYELLFLGLAAGLYQLLRRYEPVKRVVISYHVLMLLVAAYAFITTVTGLPTWLGKDKPFGQVLEGAIILTVILVALRLADAILIGHLLVKRMGIHVSVLVRHLTVVVLVAGSVILVLCIFGQGDKITPLLATSAIGTAIIGLALQDVLGNVIAGVALQAEQPFKVGDWVTIGETMGRVVEMNWRATRLATLDGDHVILPNSMVAREHIRNYHAPGPVEARHLIIGVEYRAAPSDVKRVLTEAAEGADGVLKRPAPKVWLIGYDDFAVRYEIKFWLDRFGDHRDIEDNVMTRVWYLLKRNRITIPFPIRNVFHHSPPEAVPAPGPTLQPGSEEVVAILRGVKLLEPLSDEELRTLSNGLKVALYTTGELLVRQDDPGDSFFVIADGHVSVRVNDTEVAKLSDRDHFGEMSLMTGQPRNATVAVLSDTRVLVIDRECFHTVLEANPAVVEKLAEALQRANAEKAALLESAGATGVSEKPDSGTSLLRHVRRFFGLK